MSRVSILEAEELRLPVQVYPNPATNEATVITGCGERQMMTVYGIDGRIVLQQDVRERATIDLGGWNRGIYIIKVGSRTSKLVKN